MLLLGDQPDVYPSTVLDQAIDLAGSMSEGQTSTTSDRAGTARPRPSRPAPRLRRWKLLKPHSCGGDVVRVHPESQVRSARNRREQARMPLRQGSASQVGTARFKDVDTT
jgi:hypothetical protein